MDKRISNIEVLNAFNMLIPYLRFFFDDEVILAINDSEKCLRYDADESMHSNVAEGDSLKPGTATYDCTMKGIPVTVIVPEDVLGVPLKSTAVPVKDDTGKVVGSLCVARSLKRQEEIKSISKSLSTSLEQMSTAITEVADGIQNVANMSMNMSSSIQ